MALSYVGGAVGQSSGSTTTDSTVALNSGLTGGSSASVSQGDLVIVSVCLAHSDDAPTVSLVSSGYTALTQLNADNTRDTSFNVFYKFMGATPDTSVVISRSGNIENSLAYAVQVFAGVDTSSPMDVTPVSATGTGTGLINAPAITPITSGSWILAAGGNNNATSTDLISYSTDFIDQLADAASDTQDAKIGVGYYIGWTSGSYDPAACTTGGTQTSASWCSYTLALRPASSGVTGSASVTLGAATLSSSGASIVDAVVSKTLGALTTSSTGTSTIVAEATITLGACTVVSDGNVFTGVECAAEITLSSISLSSAVSNPVEATASITLGTLTVSSSGEVATPGREASATITLGALTVISAGESEVVASASITLGAATLSSAVNVPELTEGLRGILLFMSDFRDGDFEDIEHQFLLFYTSDTTESWTNADLWMKFLAERGQSSGSLYDRTRNYLIGYLAIADTGQTIYDLWDHITDKYSGA